MVTRRHRTEEGQVYPALLLAIIGGFAIAVGFLGIQNLLDQTGRAASASDAAALAVGTAHRDRLVSLFDADPVGQWGQLPTLLENLGEAPDADQVAGRFARANGAEVEGLVTYQGFDAGSREWAYQVTTRQRDTVHGGSSSAHAESRSRVAVDITGGLCADLSGIEVDGHCIDAAQHRQDCVAPPPPPPPPPPAPPSGSPSPPPSPAASPSAPPFHQADYCGRGLEQLLQWKIHLVN